MSEEKENANSAELDNKQEDIADTPDEETGQEGNESVETVDIKGTAEYQELNDRYLRLAAEFENYKKRSAREYTRLIETAESNLILEMLQVTDDFSRALKHDTENQADFRQGVELIANKLDELLSRRGVRPIESINKQFDPNYHEAVMQVELDDKEDGVIVEEVQKGYFLNDIVLRPAKVVVAKQKEESPEENDDNESTDAT